MSKGPLLSQIGIPVLVVAGAAAVEYLRTNGLLEHLMGTPAATKPYGDFDGFYTHRYLPEHSQPGTKALHVMGTSCMAVLMVLNPALLVALACGIVVGLSAFPFLRSVDSGVPEMALMLGVYLLVGSRLAGFKRAFMVPAVAYALAWIGHFFVEVGCVLPLRER